MPISASDIQFKLSGGAANADGNASLGGAKSSVNVPTTLDALFDQTNETEAAAGDVEYRCIYITNAYAQTMVNGKAYLSANTPSASTTMAIGLGTAAVNATEQTVANESTAPAGVTFSEPATQGAGLTIPSLPTGQHIALWIRRTVTAAAVATNNDTWQLSVYGAST